MRGLPQASRVLMVRLSALGDCIHALPVVAALRTQRPDLFLGWAIEPAGHCLLEHHPMVDRFHVYPRRARGLRRFQELARFRRELRAERYDLVIDLQGLAKSGLVSWWSGARARLGFAGPESRELNWIFMTQRRRVADSLHHVVDRNLDLLRALGIDSADSVEFPLPPFPPSEELGRFLSAADQESGFAVLNPGAGWATKRWPTQRFVSLASHLASHLALPSVVVWGNEAERSQARAIVARAGGATRLAPATDLKDLAALLSRAALFVGNDTGPMHLASALRTPTVALFGASDVKRNGPYRHADFGMVARRAPDCQPCQKTHCRRGDLACLERLDEQQVLEACRERLALRRPAPDERVMVGRPAAPDPV